MRFNRCPLVQLSAEDRFNCPVVRFNRCPSVQLSARSRFNRPGVRFNRYPGCGSTAYRKCGSTARLQKTPEILSKKIQTRSNHFQTLPNLVDVILGTFKTFSQKISSNSSKLEDQLTRIGKGEINAQEHGKTKFVAARGLQDVSTRLDDVYHVLASISHGRNKQLILGSRKCPKLAKIKEGRRRKNTNCSWTKIAKEKHLFHHEKRLHKCSSTAGRPSSFPLLWILG